MKKIAQFILEAIKNVENDEKLQEIKEKVEAFCMNFPL